jgi:hypothetical protein
LTEEVLIEHVIGIGITASLTDGLGQKYRVAESSLVHGGLEKQLDFPQASNKEIIFTETLGLFGRTLLERLEYVNQWAHLPRTQPVAAWVVSNRTPRILR